MDAHSLGRYLRETREAKELTLEDAVYSLKIRQRILEAFEQGEFMVDGISAVQIRGFLRNYARFLGLDSDVIIQYYESATQDKRRGRLRRKKKRSQDRVNVPVAPGATVLPPPLTPHKSMGDRRDASERRLLRLFNVLMVVLVSAVALGVILFVIVQLLEQPDDRIQPEQLAQLPPSPTYTLAPTFTPRPIITDLPRLAHNYTGQGVLVTIEIQQRTWMRVLTDGNSQDARLFLPGEVREYQGVNEVFVNASNAKALNIIYNGQQQGLFGGRGQAVEITFTLDYANIITGPGFDPTAVFSPTPLPTQDNLAGTLIVARTPSDTPGPSPTPSNTPTITETPSDTPTVTYTPSPTDTPTITFTPSNTPTPSDTPTITPTPSNTAVLPPRATQPNPTSTKDGA